MSCEVGASYTAGRVNNGHRFVLTVVFLWIILAVVPTFLRERREDQERRAEMLKWAQERAARRLTKG